MNAKNSKQEYYFPLDCDFIEVKMFYKILTASLLCGFLYLQYDIKSDTANIYYADSLISSDSVTASIDSLELKKIKLAEGKLL